MKPHTVVLLAGLAAAGCGKSDGGAVPPADGGALDVSAKDAPTDPAVDPLSEPPADAPADAPAEASDAGSSANPVWTEIGEIAGCKVQRLANASDVRVFTWSACDGIPGCERAKYDPNVVPKYGHVGGADVGYVNGLVVASQVVLHTAQNLEQVFFVDEGGRAIDGYRVDPSGPDTCHSKQSSIGSSRYAALVCNYTSALQEHCGAVLCEPGAAPLLFSLDTPLTGLVVEFEFGDTRWLWNWTMPSFLS